jgi:3-methyladenine DNA glycosylase AlkD
LEKLLIARIYSPLSKTQIIAFDSSFKRMNDILNTVRHALLNAADEKTRNSGLRYFKEEVDLYGVKSAEVGRIGKEYFNYIPDKSKASVFSLCEELWQSGKMEESFIACNWSYNLKKSFVPEDFATIERWVTRYLSNWASCDTLCNHTIGSFVDMYPSFLANLKQWAISPNRWVRRASAVSLIIPARQGRYLSDIFKIADILLTDRDDMVQKGYGWMLKSASQAHQSEVFDYVMENKAVMPRTALRYAIEKMPAELKVKAMAK